jgi:hypothetical protein
MEAMRDAYKVWWGNLMECDHLKDQSIDRRIILKRIYKKGMWRHGLVCSGSEEGHGAGCCECGNEPAG